MSFPVLVLLLAMFVALWWLLRLRRGSARAAGSEPTPAADRKSTRYHAVSIKFAPGACEAARGMAGRRFLASAAPRLPLTACDAAECQCRFVHHGDRRSGKDRRSPFAASGRITATGEYREENRGGGDRRRDEDEF